MPDPTPPTPVPSPPFNWKNALATLAMIISAVIALFAKPDPEPVVVIPDPPNVVVPVDPPTPQPKPDVKPAPKPVGPVSTHVKDSKGLFLTDDALASDIAQIALKGANRYEVIVIQANAPERRIGVLITDGTGPIPPPVPVPTPTPTPTPTPVPNAPSAEMQAAMAGVKSIVSAADSAKAAKLKEAFEDWRTQMDVISPPTDKATFQIATQKYSLAVVAKSPELANAFPGLSTAMDKAFYSLYGQSEGSITVAQAKEFISGVVWACSR